jgi:predicted AAA+ superfamily ATPase
MYTERGIEPLLTKGTKSILLLGPRQTGKSTLIRRLQPDLEINLADEETYLEFLRQPGLLKNVAAGHRTVFIDEIQRIPSLLNTIQFILDEGRRTKFLLTGSSARKLKRGQANLLPGRIFTYELGPLAHSELEERFDVARALQKGLLPGIYFERESATWKKLLRTYASTYLKEEVQAEALTRNLEGFSRFFDVICAASGSFVDFTKFASLAAIERMTARRYFDVLVDTLLIHRIDPFTKSAQRRLIQHPRYYLFDVGVLNGALGTFEISQDRIGNLFEHLVLQMLLSELKAHDLDYRLSVYRTEAGAEVDFVLEVGRKVFAIEVKASRTVGKSDFRGLKSFVDFHGGAVTPAVLYQGARTFTVDGVLILPIVAGFGPLGIPGQ